MTRIWVLVASRDHARRGLSGGFVMANHGKRAPLARMSVGDRILIYSPTTSYPTGEPLKAITIVGEVTGVEPEPSPVIEGGFRRAAALREIEPIPLEAIREHLPTAKIRFGFFELPDDDAAVIWALVRQRASRSCVEVAANAFLGGPGVTTAEPAALDNGIPPGW